MLDHDDLDVWESQYGSTSASHSPGGGVETLSAMAVASDPADVASSSELEPTAQSTSILSQDLVDAAMATDQSLQLKSGSQSGSGSTGVSVGTASAEESTFQLLTEDSLNSQSSDPFADPSGDIIDDILVDEDEGITEELLDELFAEEELVSIL